MMRAQESGFGIPAAAAQPVDPNNPPWGIPGALLGLAASVALLVIAQFVFIIPYLIYLAKKGQDVALVLQSLGTDKPDKTAIFLAIASTIPAHLLTILVIWAIVTRFKKYPFWQTLGWSWSRHFGFWTCAGLAVGLLILSTVALNIIGGKPTDIDQIVASSAASRYATAFLAAVTAPLVEEMIYRGLLYPALQRTIGMTWAVVIVTALFAGVHVYQYRTNLGVIAAIALLSLTLTLVRAFSGRLLPCFIIHAVFNGLQSIYIIFQPYLERYSTAGEQKSGTIFFLLAKHLHIFF